MPWKTLQPSLGVLDFNLEQWEAAVNYQTRQHHNLLFMCNNNFSCIVEYSTKRAYVETPNSKRFVIFGINIKDCTAL